MYTYTTHDTILMYSNSQSFPQHLLFYFLFQTLAVFWTLYTVFWVILRGSEFYVPTFRNTLYPQHSIYLPAYEDVTECSETLAHKIQTPGELPRRQHTTHFISLLCTYYDFLYFKTLKYSCRAQQVIPSINFSVAYYSVLPIIFINFTVT